MNFIGGGFLGGGPGGGGTTTPPATVELTGGEPVEHDLVAETVNGGTGDVILASGLTDEPVNADSVIVFHNEIKAHKGINYNLVGATNQQIQWLGTSPAPLDVGDTLEVRFEKAIAIPASALNDAIRVSVGRSSDNAIDLWLLDSDGIATNLSPILFPFDVTLIAVSITTRDVETWAAELYKGATVRAGGTPLVGGAIMVKPVTAVNSLFDSALSVDVDAGEEIGVFARGTGISYPRVDLWFQRR